MGSLSRLFGLTEAQERMISQQEVERQFPEAAVFYDRDIGGQKQGRPTFFMQGKNLFVNVKSGGWWLWLPDDPPENPHWQKTDNPKKWRGGDHKARRQGYTYDPYLQQNMVDGEQIVDDDYVAKHFGKHPLILARKMGIAPDQRQFRISPVGARRRWDKAGNRSSVSGSSTMALIMDTMGPEVDGEYGPENMIADIYEWDERANTWRGPY